MDDNINKNEETGICQGFLSKEMCIMDAANKLKIENPNEYGDPSDLLIQLEGFKREQTKENQNENARSRSKSTKEKSALPNVTKTFKNALKKLSAISESKAGRRTRNRRRKPRK